jgi:hypothetical protein
MALARRKEFSKIQLAGIMMIYLIVLFISFSAGSRNVVAVHLATFSISNIFSLSRIRFLYVAILSVTILGSFVFLSYHMLEFRNMGIRAYMKHQQYSSEEVRDTLFIDFNLVSLGKLTSRFPNEFRYLGLEVPIWALVKPIPRGLWKGKPKGLSIDIEDAMGVEGVTIAATFIGEAYMGGGPVWVFLSGLFFGALASWWNRLGADSRSTLGLLTYATGFFGGLLCMRSMFWLTTGLLPSLALIFFGKFIYPRFFQNSD